MKAQPPNDENRTIALKVDYGEIELGRAFVFLCFGFNFSCEDEQKEASKSEPKLEIELDEPETVVDRFLKNYFSGNKSEFDKSIEKDLSSKSLVYNYLKEQFEEHPNPMRYVEEFDFSVKTIENDGREAKVNAEGNAVFKITVFNVEKQDSVDFNFDIELIKSDSSWLITKKSWKIQ